VLLVLATAVAAVTAGSHAATRHEVTYAYRTQTRQGIDAYWLRVPKTLSTSCDVQVYRNT